MNTERLAEARGPLLIGLLILILGCLVSGSLEVAFLVFMFSIPLTLLLLVLLGVFNE